MSYIAKWDANSTSPVGVPFLMAVMKGMKVDGGTPTNCPHVPAPTTGPAWAGASAASADPPIKTATKDVMSDARILDLSCKQRSKRLTRPRPRAQRPERPNHIMENAPVEPLVVAPGLPVMSPGTQRRSPESNGRWPARSVDLS